MGRLSKVFQQIILQDTSNLLYIFKIIILFKLANFEKNLMGESGFHSSSLFIIKAIAMPNASTVTSFLVEFLRILSSSF